MDQTYVAGNNVEAVEGDDCDLVLLQAARLKGRLTAETAELFALDVPTQLTRLEESGLLQAGKAGARLTPAGREKLATLIARERAGIDQPALTRLYARFEHPNTEIKATVSAWQLRPDGTPNDHTDAGYDAAVVTRLVNAYAEALPLISELTAVAGRLSHYPGRLGLALQRAAEGEPKYVANPLVDSFHQVWFELHEDLLGLLGLDRVAEASAGRAE